MEFPQITSKIDSSFINYFHSFLLTNYDKILLLENKKLSQFDNNEITDFKINIQTTYSHQNMGALVSEANVLLKVSKGNIKKEKVNSFENIFEIEEKNLDEMITRLKEVYNKIKN